MTAMVETPLLSSSILCSGNDLQNRLFFVQNKGPVMELLAAIKESTFNSQSLLLGGVVSSYQSPISLHILKNTQMRLEQCVQQ